MSDLNSATAVCTATMIFRPNHLGEYEVKERICSVYCLPLSAVNWLEGRSMAHTEHSLVSREEGAGLGAGPGEDTRGVNLARMSGILHLLACSS